MTKQVATEDTHEKQGEHNCKGCKCYINFNDSICRIKTVRSNSVVVVVGAVSGLDFYRYLDCCICDSLSTVP